MPDGKHRSVTLEDAHSKKLAAGMTAIGLSLVGLGWIGTHKFMLGYKSAGIISFNHGRGVARHNGCLQLALALMRSVRLVRQSLLHRACSGHLALQLCTPLCADRLQLSGPLLSKWCLGPAAWSRSLVHLLGGHGARRGRGLLEDRRDVVDLGRRLWA